MTEPAAAPEEAAASAEGQGPTPGQLLAARRAERRLSVADVAQRLKFAPRQIEALEADDYERLHGATIVRGMMRGYARMLELDPAPLLAEFERHSQPAAERIAPHDDAIPFPRGAKPGNRVYMVLSVAMLVVALLVIYEWQFSGLSSRIAGQEPAPTATVTAPKEGQAAAPETPPAPAAGIVATNTGNDAGTVAGISAQSASAPPVPGPAPAAPSASSSGTAPAAPAAAPSAAPAKTTLAPYASSSAPSANAPAPGAAAGVVPPPAATEAKQDKFKQDKSVTPAGKVVQMSFHFDSDSWVRVKQANGKVLMAQLNRGGTEQVVEGQPPFDVIIGNAPSVRLTYNNAPVDLRPYFKVDVARLTLE